MYYADRSFDFEAAEFYLIPLLCQSFIFRMAQYIITKQPVGPHTLGNIIKIRKKRAQQSIFITAVIATMM